MSSHDPRSPFDAPQSPQAQPQFQQSQPRPPQGQPQPSQGQPQFQQGQPQFQQGPSQQQATSQFPAQPQGPTPQQWQGAMNNGAASSTSNSWGTPQPGAGYAPPQVFKSRPSKAKLGMASFLAVALLSAGVGGTAALSAEYFLVNDTATSPVSATQVVQADPSNPDWAEVAASVSDAVVAIQVASSAGSGQGSGVLLDDAGTIVTNNHVIDGGSADAQLRVVVDNQAFEATVVGTDPSTDLAVIRLVDPPSDLKTVAFADSSELVVGEPVMAIGNPLGLSDTVTTGIVSALNRPVTTPAVSATPGDQGNGVVVTAAVQTSAAINPGNSGGALLNTSGELIGITSSIATLSSGSAQTGSIGLGFAIGSDQVRYIADQLIASGTAQHAQLGVSASDTDSGLLLGAQVAEVVPGTGAAEAGIEVGDVITSVDSVDVASSESLVALIRNAEVGQEVELAVVRNGDEQEVTVTLGSAEG
ncbi:MAG: S1C family serine protease [Arachnia sp.]